MQIAYSGTHNRIYNAEDDPDGQAHQPVESWNEAIRHASLNNEQHNKLIAKMAARIAVLGDGGRLRNPDHFNTEGLLPNGKHFFAIKVSHGRHNFRAYGWYSNRHNGSFIISHYAYKKGEKLDSRDTSRVVATWREIENRE